MAEAAIEACLRHGTYSFGNIASVKIGEPTGIVVPRFQVGDRFQPAREPAAAPADITVSREGTAPNGPATADNVDLGARLEPIELSPDLARFICGKADGFRGRAIRLLDELNGRRQAVGLPLIMWDDRTFATAAEAMLEARGVPIS
jgi:hypothetical protein